MSVKHEVSVAAIAAFTGLAGTSALAQLTIPTVPIGNPGNAADPTTGNLYGSVAYTYNIGATEVTNAQYAAFLNAVAATDTYALYKTNMAGSFGGITRSGSPGSYTYSTVSGRANNPVNFVTFWDATRFANWLHNGQPTGEQDNRTTENGAYTLNPAGISANTITRNAGWQWAVTSEDEWYKAAYYQPANQGGDSDNYWLYPTSSNSVPTTAQANFNGVNGITSVGTYAANFFGTFDMGGSVFEWNESIVFDRRFFRGGSWVFVGNPDPDDDSYYLSAYSRSTANASTWGTNVGFRVSQVPGPSSVALLAVGGLGALRRRR